VSGTLILYYHSVSENADRRIDPSIVVRPAHFERQLCYLSKHTHVVSLTDLSEAVRQKRALPPNSVVITFDDGYRDNFTTVAPLLKQYGFPATFFLATGYIGTGRVKWEDRLSYILHNTAVSKILVEHAGLPGSRFLLSLGSSRDRLRAFNRLAASLGCLAVADREFVIDQIRELARIPVEQGIQNMMLTWDDVRQMAGIPGFTFGCHTVEHERLSMLSDGEVRRQILESRHKIEGELQVSVCCFAYPYGVQRDFDQRAIRVLRDSGFDCAVTTNYTRNGPRSEPFSLGRIIAADAAGPWFSLGLAVRGSPTGELIRNALNLWKRVTRT
jgi:peptidoglycan/xylan/chitin deacetylase (PgdA/CDA1 family)